MVLKVQNTLTRKVEEFRPADGKKVKMFVCGPTVYDYSHIGHAKTYISFDVIARYLRYRGYDVFYLQNITDIDDKIIRRANEAGGDPIALADRFYREYLKDMDALGVTSVSKYAKASDYIPQIVEQVRGLMDKGYAYEAGDGIYFEVPKFAEYGKLSHRTGDEIRKERVEPNPNKRNPEDFALWKRQKPGEPGWDSPWGKGRPGWHIEDTAITISEFGPQYDLHGGGMDLIFPHHEAEIAQAEAFTGRKPFVRYWLHAGFLKIGGDKMAKSLGNFITIREALSKYDSQTLRFFYLMTPFHAPINYGDDGIKAAGEELGKIRNVLDALGFALQDAVTEAGPEEKALSDSLQDRKGQFIAAMDNNFNTSEGLAVILTLVRDTNRLITEKKLRNADLIKALLAFFAEVGGVLGLALRPGIGEVPPEIASLLAQREGARKKKDFKTADELRKAVLAKGYELWDTPQGPKVRLRHG